MDNGTTKYIYSAIETLTHKLWYNKEYPGFKGHETDTIKSINQLKCLQLVQPYDTNDRNHTRDHNIKEMLVYWK